MDDAPTGKRHEDFAAVVDQALRLGWSGHFEMARTLLAPMRDRPALTRGQRAVCRALLALASAALDDLGAARRLARQAIHDTARPAAGTTDNPLRDLQVARALAVNAGELIGDRVRARRAAQVRFMADNPGSAWLLRANAKLHWLDAPSPVQRYAKFVAAVHRRFEQVRPARVLTRSELRILTHLAAGRSVRHVATLLGRSEYTVRTHLRNSYPKLGVHRRDEAIGRARALGLLDS